MRSILIVLYLLSFALIPVITAPAQQIEMLPYGPYVAHCRAVDCQINWGGDDDNNNIYFIAVDPALADGTANPDFYIHIWDGDNNATGTLTGTQDFDIYNQPGYSVFEYRLYGGIGASFNDDGPPGQDPSIWTGILIDIDSDPGDLTLATDDPDDNDGNDPEDLRDLDHSVIGVDMDGNPGDLVGGLLIYKFVVDGTFGPGGEWNRYEVQATRDAGRTDATGIHLYVYELTYAGHPSSGGGWTNLSFRVPPTPTHEIDIQTLDLDRDDSGIYPQSTLSTPSVFYDDSLTYESDDQYVGNSWMWTSLNQQVAPPNGDGVIGMTYAVPPDEEGMLWTLDINAGHSRNPFSVKLNDKDAGWLPMFFDPVFVIYGSGPIHFFGTGLPQAGGPGFTLEAVNANPNALGLLFISLNKTEVQFPGGYVLYVDLPFLLTVNMSFDGTGSFSLPAYISSGTPGIDLYMQTFALVKPLEHSNGLKVTVLP